MMQEPTNLGYRRDAYLVCFWSLKCGSQNNESLDLGLGFIVCICVREGNHMEVWTGHTKLPCSPSSSDLGFLLVPHVASIS